MNLFRELNEQETKQFEQYARENDPPIGTAWEVMHPVCRKVWIRRGLLPLQVRKLGENWLVEDIGMEAVIAVFQNEHDALAAKVSIAKYVELLQARLEIE